MIGFGGMIGAGKTVTGASSTSLSANTDLGGAKSIRIATPAGFAATSGMSFITGIQVVLGGGLATGPRVYVGPSSGSGVFSSAPTQIVFGGSGRFSVSSSTTLTSDLCTVGIAASSQILFSANVDGTSQFGDKGGLSTDWACWENNDTTGADQQNPFTPLTPQGDSKLLHSIILYGY
jgi:hypothetical protein